MLPLDRKVTPVPRTGLLLAPSKSGHSLLSFPVRVRSVSGILLILALALAGGCTRQSGGVIDPAVVPPFISGATASPDTIKMKSLPQSNGVLTVTVRAQAILLRQSGTAGIESLSAGVIAAGANDPLLTVQLHDDGVAPDSIAGDGSYSALIQFTISRSASGVFRLKMVASDNQGYTSNIVEVPLFMVRDSHAPVLSNLVAPDSVFLPSGATVTIPLYINATDVDGQADINQVYFQNLDSKDPTQRYIMKNDGSAPGSVAGDSTYAIIVQASDSPSVRRSYRFAFQAVNNFGDTSATLLHSITIY
jgi:hypothetical protein